MELAQSFLFGFDHAIAVRPQPGQIKARYLSGFRELVEDAGGNLHRILERHDIDPLTFADPDQNLDCASAASMMDYCAARFDDPIFGLHLADRQNADVFGVVTVLARSAPTLRSALEAMAEFLPVMHSPEGPIRTVEDDGRFELRWTSRDDLNVALQPNYQGTVLLLKTVEMLGGPSCRPAYLAVNYDLDARAREAMESRFGCRVGRAQESVCGFHPSLMDRPVATANRLVFELLRSYLRQARRQSPCDTIQQARSFVRGTIHTGHCSLKRCASYLGLSPRTFQKRLARADLSFTGIVERERSKLACEALSGSTAPLDQVAVALGYSDQSCFGRAFKEWHGISPHEYRKQAARTA